MRLLTRIVLLCTLIFILFALTVPAQAQTALAYQTYLPIMYTKQSAEYYNVGQDLAGETARSLDQMLPLMRTANVHSVRMPFRWHLIEPEQGQFEWDHHDSVVAQARAHNIEIMGVLVSTPSWANGRTEANTPAGHDADAYPPLNSADFSTYAGTLAARYAGQVDKWVVFNEPNLAEFWQPQPHPHQYVEMLCDAYAAIKTANPNALVIGGALSGNGINMGWEPSESQNFLEQMYLFGAKDCFDILAIHPYMYPTTPIALLQYHLDATRAMMTQYNDNKPIWINEIGWADSPNAWDQPTVSQAQIATWLGHVYGQQLKGAERIYWYNFKDVGIDPTNPELHFGLLNYDFSPKPAFNMFISQTGGS